MQTRRARTSTPPADVKTLPVLILYVVVLVAIPSELVVGPLGAAGTPAGLISMGLMLWWVASLVTARVLEYRGRGNPVKWLLIVFASSLLVSYVFGMFRAISTVTEVNSADRAVLALCGWCGIVLVVIDGVSTRKRLDTLLTVLVAGGALIAALGLLQYFFGLDLARIIHIPGLTPNGSFGEVITRSSFRRVTGTASHPIEFGVVLSMILPIALHYARFALARRTWWWTAVVLMGAAIPLSVARSGIIGAAVALVIMYFTWPKNFRHRILAGLVAGLLACSVVVPGLLGTFRSLFLNSATDTSTAGRTDDYAPAWAYIKEAPLFGRGFGTFIPDLYRTLDNQYLGLIIEAGLLGLLSTLILFVGAMVVAALVRRRATLVEDRDLAQTLLAGIAVVTVNAATFDLFAFSMCAGMAFLLLGAIGAFHSFSVPPGPPPQVISFKATVAIALGGLLVVGLTTVEAKVARPEYQAIGTVILEPPATRDLPPLSVAGRASTAASVLRDTVIDEDSRSRLQAHGVDGFDIAIGDGSLMMGTDRHGSGGATLHVIARSGTDTGAQLGLARVIQELKAQLAQLQNKIGVPDREGIRLEVLAINAPVPVSGRPSRAILGGVVLAVIFTACAAHILRRRRHHEDTDLVLRHRDPQMVF